MLSYSRRPPAAPCAGPLPTAKVRAGVPLVQPRCWTALHWAGGYNHGYMVDGRQYRGVDPGSLGNLGGSCSVATCCDHPSRTLHTRSHPLQSRNMHYAWCGGGAFRPMRCWKRKLQFTRRMRPSRGTEPCSYTADPRQAFSLARRVGGRRWDAHETPAVRAGLGASGQCAQYHACQVQVCKVQAQDASV